MSASRHRIYKKEDAVSVMVVNDLNTGDYMDDFYYIHGLSFGCHFAFNQKNDPKAVANGIPMAAFLMCALNRREKECLSVGKEPLKDPVCVNLIESLSALEHEEKNYVRREG